MRDLTIKEREFFESLIKLAPQKRDNYFYYNKNGKHYKRSRVHIQLYLNKKLEPYEQVHHRDENKCNDDVSNLKVINTKRFNFHVSDHHSGKKKKYSMQKRRGLSVEQQNKIQLLSKTIKNKSEIARILNLSSQTIGKYLNSFKQKFDE